MDRYYVTGRRNNTHIRHPQGIRREEMNWKGGINTIIDYHTLCGKSSGQLWLRKFSLTNVTCQECRTVFIETQAQTLRQARLEPIRQEALRQAAAEREQAAIAALHLEIKTACQPTAQSTHAQAMAREAEISRKIAERNAAQQPRTVDLTAVARHEEAARERGEILRRIANEAQAREDAKHFARVPKGGWPS